MKQTIILDQEEIRDVKYALVKALARACPRYKDMTEDSSMLCTALDILTDSSEGSQTVTVDGRAMQAYNIGTHDWLYIQRICKITCEFDEDALDEGMQFNFELHPSIEDVESPDCDCSPRGYEISPTIRIKGNSYDSNADTYATQLGIQAETMYLFWITDQKQYGVVRKRYWCL